MVSLLAAGWFGAMAYMEFEQDSHLHDGSLVTTGEVVEVHQKTGRFETSYVVVEFTSADGRNIRADVEDYYWRPYPRVGDRPRLRYDPDDPAGFVRDERIRPDRVEEVLLAAAALGFLTWPVFATVRSGLRR